MNKSISNYLKSFSIPLGIILLGVIVGRVFFIIMKNWAWIPIVLFYWTAISLVLYFDYKKNRKKPIDYFKAYKFKISALILSLLVGLIPLPILLKYYHLFDTNYLIILWLLVAIINPFFEEIFWRGYMLDISPKIPFWIKAIVSSLLFAVAHPLTWGIFSQNMLTVEMLISVFIMGIVWSFVYKKSKSLFLPYFSHLLVDLFNCSVLAFLNLLPVMSNLY
ncbi:MAG: CPBP family intramembrane metalloprotease [Bacteroidales bacterium]|nr:CPBP family intramembrane metalloprotease [Bacteroidales bacterium]MBN2758560.1 CPBP family intramembrane metalloprotease [Bacteroidales bacterium]